MTDETTGHGDDAPPASWKKGDGLAAAGLGEAAHGGFSAAVVTINRPVGEVFAYFRDFANLPTFMDNVVSIDMLGDGRSHWVVKAPAGRTVEWDARVTEERQDELVAWTSEPGADVENGGRVTFQDAGARGTIVTATIAYDPPAGVVGKLIAKMFQREPAIQARRDLRRFKQLLETGEITTSAWTNKQREEEAA